MSNRDSLGVGDLLPQDVVDIFAQEKQGNRGRKKRSRSLGRALGWLKGKKRKDVGAKGQGPGLGPALDLALDSGRSAGHHGGHKGSQRAGRPSHPHGNSHAAPKRDNDDKAPTPPSFHENVFIEGNRPKYVEDLHTEALEGLKMMQQQETNNGVEFKDNESTVSAMTVHTDGEGEGFVTDSTIADSTSVISVQSSVSSRSSRSGLTRQGSTFRPLNSGKRSEKAKTRRRHRKTVDGIPRHVQRELGLDRAAWAATPTLDEEEQLHNGESDVSSPGEGPQQESDTGDGLQDVIPPLSQEQLQQLHAGHRDDLALLHCLGPDLSAGPRPQSLAVPWLTTASSLLQAPPSPVMSMSPQAAYMSKIIPNAVLPPSIDVVEISRGRSRNSVRTVSKSSLLVSSPAPSRASSRASTITSASQHNPPNMSESSCWSNSESSETLVSDSSTISSNSTSRQKSQERDGSAKEDGVSVRSSVSKTSKCTSNGKVVAKGDEGKREGPFVRSLSVMKPKRAPPPPSRSYSLHNKMKRRSRDLAEVKIISEESPPHSVPASGDENEKNSRVIDSPGYNADTSSLDESMNSVSFSPQLQALKAEQAAKTNEAVSKNASQERPKPQQESKPAATLSPSSGYSSQEGPSAQLSKETTSPRHKRGIFAKLQKLFPGSSSPTPPVQPPAPQPQAKAAEKFKPVSAVDITNPSVKALLELFNIPPPPKVHAPPPPPPEVWAHSKRSFELLLGPPAPDNIYAIIKKNPKDRRQQRKSGNESLHTPEMKKVPESGILTAEVQKESDDRLAEQNVDVKGNRKVTENEKVIVSGILNGMLVKAAERREERLATVKEEETRNAAKTYTDTIPAISAARIPPCPSPPPTHNPPQPPTKHTAEITSGSLMPAVGSPESWPPPPPPMGLSGPDDIDFPLPPPPMFGEEEFVIPVQVPSESPVPGSDPSSSSSSSSKAQKRHTSQGISPTPLNIPPPPPYTAPPPPLEAVYSSTLRKVSPPPPPKVVLLPSSKRTSPLPPKKASPPPKETSPPPPPQEVHTLLFKEVVYPPPEAIPPPPPKEISPSPKEVSLPPPIEISPPAPREAFPPPPGDILPPPPQEISTPPEEAAPPPPKEVSPPPAKEVAPPPKEVSPPPAKEVAPPPPPKEVSPPPAKEVAPPPKKVSPPPPPKDVSPPPPPKEVSPPPPPKDVSPPPPPKEVSPPPPPKDVSPPPPPKEVAPPPPSEEVSPPPTVEVSPPPPPKETSQPSKEIAPPHEVVSPPPAPKEICTPPSQEVSPPQETTLLPPPSIEVPPAPPKEIPSPPLEQVSPPLSDQASPVKPTESSPPVVEESPPPLVPDTLPTVVTVVSSSPDKEEPVMVRVSPTPPNEVSTEEVSPAASPENAVETSTEDTSVSRLTPPQSIPPPPPQPQPSEPEIDVPEEKVQPESETNPCDSILTPPQSIPPPPPTQLQHQATPTKTDDAAPQETIDPPPSESSNSPTLENSPLEKTEETQEPAPSPPADIPLQDPPSTESQPSPTSTENQTSTTAVQEEHPPIIIQPVVQPPEAEEKPEAEDTLRAQPLSSQIIPPISTSAEAPQKPIRKSLILTNPSPSPSQPALPKSQSLVIPSTSSSSALSPTKKSPPAMGTSPSMNLQEAIRLRTAARARGGAPSHLNLHSPTSPMSSTSTASFIFSKSNRKVVVETKAPEKAASEAELAKKDAKVPPPVARKPKSKGKESEGPEQTAGQEAQPESVMAEKTNGTAGTVEGGDAHPA